MKKSAPIAARPVMEAEYVFIGRYVLTYESKGDPEVDASPAGRNRQWSREVRTRWTLTPTAATSYGSPVPDLLFAKVMSALLMNPSVFKSSRKLKRVTVLPDWLFV